MPETELGEVESANEAFDRADWIVRPDIVLNPRRKETGLIPAIADLECAIRHKPNRTSTLKTHHSCPASSGKSPALFHHRAICKTAHGPAHRALGAITGQKSRQLKLHRNFSASALNPSGSAIARSSTAFRCERLRVD